MSYYGNVDWLTQVKMGLVSNHRLIHKFGRNSAVGTAPVPVSIGGIYATPVANTALEILSDDVNDTAAGSGAQKVTVKGLTISGGLFVAQEEEVTMNGTTAVILANSYVRVFRAWISESGTYAGQTAVSSPGTITIRVSVGGATWLQIDEFVAGNSAGQSQVALYTTPSATKSILYSPIFTVDSVKSTSLYLFHRPDADDVTTPFSARRLVHEWLGVANGNSGTGMLPVAYFEGATDIGFMAEVGTGTGAVSAEFWLLEIDD